MKKDRFLTGILVAITALVGIALAVFFLRQGEQTYVADRTPDGVVHDFALAVIQKEYQRAYSYLAEAEHKPTYQAFREAFVYQRVNPGSFGLEIGAVEIVGERAYVTVYLNFPPSDPFSSGYRTEDMARLVLQTDTWKLLQMPYQLWGYDWYQPQTKAIE